ncbi:unnamed protein product, partial [Nesidiocoris tenuis]
MDIKVQIDKFEGAGDWIRWKKEVTLLLKHCKVMDVVEGTLKEPVKPADDAAEAVITKYTSDLEKFNDKDILAQLVLVKSLNRANAELVNTCTSARAIWNKLLSVYEQSSGQRLDRLLEQFFNVTIDPSEDIASHVSRLQRTFAEINEELERLTTKSMPDLVLMSRVMSTLPQQYFEFKSVWESVPVEDRTIEKLTERLRLIEMRLPNKTDDSSALATNAGAKPKWNKRKGKQKKPPHDSDDSFRSGSERQKRQPKEENLRRPKQPTRNDALLCEIDSDDDVTYRCDLSRGLSSDSWIADSACS